MSLPGVCWLDEDGKDGRGTDVIARSSKSETMAWANASAVVARSHGDSR